MEFTKPKRLNSGDTIAIVSPSWSGPSIFPNVYENGLDVLKDWGFKIKEFPTARMTGDPSLENVKSRAKDVNDAFADKEVKAIFVSIGGDDSVRLLPYLDKEVISNNPKIFMGYSDTTTMLTFINQLGLVTFNGPSVMAGFAQMGSLPESYKKHVKDLLCNPTAEYTYPSFNVYTDGYADWSQDGNEGKAKELKSDKGMRVLQGEGKVLGTLFGGCIEVLEFMKGTKYWPKKDFWVDKVLFLETSEEKPSIQSIKWMLRNYGVQGVFENAAAILFARARDYTDEEKIELDRVIQEVVSVEFGQPNFPIVTNVEFGHTDPQIILPNGISIEIDLHETKLTLMESAVL